MLFEVRAVCVSKPASQELLVPTFYRFEDGGTLLVIPKYNKFVRHHDIHVNTHYNIHNILRMFVYACEQTPVPSMTAIKIKCRSLGVYWAYRYPQANKDNPSLSFTY